MNRRRRRRKRRKARKQSGSGGLGGLQGISPKQMQKALGQIDTDEVSGVEEVIIRTKDEEIVMKNPEVTKMNMGQEIWNIVPEGGTSRRPRGQKDTTSEETDDEAKEIEIKEDDIELIVNTAGVSRDEAEEAIKENDGDIAAAIMSLK